MDVVAWEFGLSEAGFSLKYLFNSCVRRVVSMASKPIFVLADSENARLKLLGAYGHDGALSTSISLLKAFSETREDHSAERWQNDAASTTGSGVLRERERRSLGPRGCTSSVIGRTDT